MKNRLTIFTISLIVIVNLQSLGIVKASTPLLVWLPCPNQVESSCIESLSTISDSGVRTQAYVSSQIRNYSDGFALQTFGNSPREWITPNVKHENGTENVILKVFYFEKGRPYCWGQDSCATDVDEIVVDLSGGWWNTGRQPLEFKNESSDLQCGTPNNRIYCVPGWGLNPDYKYQLVLRIPKDFDLSFLVGEGLNGNLRVIEENSNFKKIEITTSPALRSIRWTRYYENGVTNFDLSSDYSTRIINFYVHSSKSGNTQWLSRCDYGKGLSIWHNGSIIEYPRWDSENENISLKLAGMHTREDGSPNVGTFYVAIPINIAECLWKVDLTKKINALMSATYDSSGKTEIVTVTSKLQGQNYFLAANGFHYSSPTLRFKLIQSEPTTDPSNPPEPVTKKTISCVKGKVTKKVIAVNPKCPAGYKVKK